MRSKLCASVHGDEATIKTMFPHVLVANKVIYLRFQLKSDAQELLDSHVSGEYAAYSTLEWGPFRG